MLISASAVFFVDASLLHNEETKVRKNIASLFQKNVKAQTMVLSSLLHTFSLSALELQLDAPLYMLGLNAYDAWRRTADPPGTLGTIARGPDSKKKQVMVRVAQTFLFISSGTGKVEIYAVAANGATTAKVTATMRMGTDAFPNQLDYMGTRTALKLAEATGMLQHCHISPAMAKYISSFETLFSQHYKVPEFAITTTTKKTDIGQFIAAFALATTMADMMALKAEVETVLGFVPYTKDEFEKDLNAVKTARDFDMTSESRARAFETVFATLYKKEGIY